ncbi:MAG: hypothetical protein JWM11_4329 [Planctomycetaceae bacterium]|nr:hypothetical protein [Planctomycetaceae bacterium]
MQDWETDLIFWVDNGSDFPAIDHTFGILGPTMLQGEQSEIVSLGELRIAEGQLQKEAGLESLPPTDAPRPVATVRIVLGASPSRAYSCRARLSPASPVQ